VYDFRMTVPVTVSEARAALPRLLDRVEAGEEIEVTRHGRVVAVLVRPDTLHTRRARPALARAAAIEERLQRARNRAWSDEHTITEDRALELVAEIDADRSR
jgi:antitoxin (DNA-binding transcriptional repressor) of toxin-antitoxin stability system